MVFSKRDKMPEVMELLPTLEGMSGKVDIKPVLLAPVIGTNEFCGYRLWSSINESCRE